MGIVQSFTGQNSYIKLVFSELLEGNVYQIAPPFLRLILGWITLVILIIGIFRYYNATDKKINRFLEFGIIYRVMNTLMYLPFTISKLFGFGNFGNLNNSIIWNIQSLLFVTAAVIVCIYYSSQIKTFQKPAFGNREKPYGPSPYDLYLVSGKITTSKWLRFKNYLIDGFFIYFIAFGALTQLMNFFSGSHLADFNNPLGFQLSILFSLWMYYFLMESIFGKTIGKIITGSAVQFYGKSSFVGALGRTFCRFIPFDTLSYLFKNGYGWHDQFSKTTVELIDNNQNVEDDDLTRHLIDD